MSSCSHHALLSLWRQYQFHSRTRTHMNTSASPTGQAHESLMTIGLLICFNMISEHQNIDYFFKAFLQSFLIHLYLLSFIWKGRVSELFSLKTAVIVSY